MTDSPNLLDDETLKLVGNYVRTKAKALAPPFVAPYLTEVDVKQGKDGKYGIKIGLDLKKVPEGSPAKSARAYEYGSGKHAQIKIKSKHQVGDYIKIVPKKAGGVLAFYWQTNIDKNFKTNGQKHPLGSSGKLDYGDGRMVFKSVMHPGVAPYKGKGYLREALIQSKEYIKEVVGADAAKNVKFKLRAVFSRPGGVKK